MDRQTAKFGTLLCCVATLLHNNTSHINLSRHLVLFVITVRALTDLTVTHDVCLELCLPFWKCHALGKPPKSLAKVTPPGPKMAPVTPGKVVPLGAPPELNNNRMLPGSKEESMLHWKLTAPVTTAMTGDTMATKVEKESGFKEKCKKPPSGGRDSNDSGGETGKATWC